MAKITVHRKAYNRKAYTRKDGVRVSASHVPAATFKIPDKGAPGRGKKLFEIKGTLGGYKTSMPTHERRRILRSQIRQHGVARVWRRLHAMVVVRKREQLGHRRIFEADRNWVAATFGTKSLTPRAAIRARRRM